MRDEWDPAEMRPRLVALGAEALADSLLRISERDDAVREHLRKLVSREAEPCPDAGAIFRASLAELTDSDGFYSDRDAWRFVEELEDLLKGLAANVCDPREGCELVAEFFRADEAIFPCCDDSSGGVAGVFQSDAKDLFVAWAKGCSNKEWIGDLVADLLERDEYSVRECLLEGSSEWLPESVLRSLVGRFDAMSHAVSRKYDSDRWVSLAELLAKELGDPPLFERLRVASKGAEDPSARMDIARVWLDAGDAANAKLWLDGIPAEGAPASRARNSLALEIATALGDASEREAIAWRIYRGHRSARALDNLLAVIGPQRRDEVVSQETKSIHANPGLNVDDARFLLDCDQMGDLERYVIKRVHLLNGQFYYDLPALADGLKRSGYALAASLVYRSLLDSILAQARSKAYHHGRDYLRHLEALAPSVTDWQQWETHGNYLERLRSEHKRKKSFWG